MSLSGNAITETKTFDWRNLPCENPPRALKNR